MILEHQHQSKGDGHATVPVMRSLRALTRHRFVRFLLAGGSGAALNVVITFGLTQFVLGAREYFTAFLIGTTVNFLYNFTLYTVAIFKTRERHLRRFFLFACYSTIITVVQLTLVHAITGVMGADWYLLVIALVILFGACFNYLVFKSTIFKGAVAPSTPSSVPPPPNLVP